MEMYIESGRKIRCTGTFTNNGTIIVSSGALNGVWTGPPSATTIVPSLTIPTAGMGGCIPASGEYGTDANTLKGGPSGCGLTMTQAYDLRHLSIYGGSGGAAGLTSGSGAGGGMLAVLCQGAIVNSASGTITAIGATGGAGGGGGGGGVVLLASKTSVSNAGTIDVSGGAGGASSSLTGGGGGGGGGIIHFISPSNSNVGTRTASGGAAGSNAVAVTTSPRFGGGAGGDSGGAGGRGSQVAAAASNLSSGNASGDEGYTIATTADPTATF